MKQLEGVGFTITKKYKLKKLRKMESGYEKPRDTEFSLFFDNMRPLTVNAENVEQKNAFIYKMVEVWR